MWRVVCKPWRGWPRCGLLLTQECAWGATPVISFVVAAWFPERSCHWGHLCFRSTTEIYDQGLKKKLYELYSLLLQIACERIQTCRQHLKEAAGKLPPILPLPPPPWHGLDVCGFDSRRNEVNRIVGWFTAETKDLTVNPLLAPRPSPVPTRRQLCGRDQRVQGAGWTVTESG